MVVTNLLELLLELPNLFLGAYLRKQQTMLLFRDLLAPKELNPKKLFLYLLVKKKMSKNSL